MASSHVPLFQRPERNYDLIFVESVKSGGDSSKAIFRETGGNEGTIYLDTSDILNITSPGNIKLEPLDVIFTEHKFYFQNTTLSDYISIDAPNGAAELLRIWHYDDSGTAWDNQLYIDFHPGQTYLEIQALDGDSSTPITVRLSSDLYMNSKNITNIEYLNFDGTSGTSGYGIRDNSGAVEFKNSGGAWAVVSVAGAPSSASYLTLGLDGTLSAERVLTAGEGIDFADGGVNSTLTINGEDATTSNKGVASFNTNHFSVSSGAVSLVANGIDDTLIDWGTGANQVSQDTVVDGSTYKQYNPASVAITGGTITGITDLEITASNTLELFDDAGTPAQFALSNSATDGLMILGQANAINEYWIAGNDGGDFIVKILAEKNINRTNDAYLRLYGSEAGAWTKYISFGNDGTNGLISTNAGNIHLTPSGGSVIIDTGTDTLTISETGAPHPTLTSSDGIINILSDVLIRNGDYLNVYSAGDDKYIQLIHDDSNGIIDVSGGQLYIMDTTNLRGGTSLTLYDSGNTNYLSMYHNDTDGQIITNSGDIILAPNDDVILDPTGGYVSVDGIVLADEVEVFSSVNFSINLQSNDTDGFIITNKSSGTSVPETWVTTYDDSGDYLFSVLSLKNATRTNDAYIRAYGSESGGWTKYISVGHDGTNGIIAGAGSLNLNPSGHDVNFIIQGTATVGTQYASKYLDFDSSGWDTTNTTNVDRKIRVYADAGSGAENAVPYSLYIDEDGGGTILQLNGLDFVSTFGGNVMPYADSSCNIGSNAVRWTNGYFDNIHYTGVTLPDDKDDIALIKEITPERYNGKSHSIGGQIALLIGSVKQLADRIEELENT